MFKELSRIAWPLGVLLLGFAVAFLPPMVLALFDTQGGVWPFAIGFALSAANGGVLVLFTHRGRPELRPRDGFVLVALSWIVIAVLAALPLRLGLAGLSVTDAIFESMSGLTTTGATVLQGLDQLPMAMKLWRCELSWIGGLGIIGLGMAVLPLLGVGGMQVYRAEATGPIKDARLTPRFAQTARSLGIIYLALTAACTFALLLAGVGPLDAICLAFSASSLGGFSNHDGSVGDIATPAIETILMVTMILAATNFATHFMAWRGKSLRPYLRDPEAKTMLAVLAASGGVLAAYIVAVQFEPTFWIAARHVGFNLVSIALGCGLYTSDYDGWPLAAGLWLLLLSCITASAGSTGGGIKMIRTMILFRASGRELFSLIHPNAMRSPKIGDQVVPDRITLSVLGFIHLYTMSIVVLSLILLASGLDLLSAFSAVIATINNVGPGLNLVGPGDTYAKLDDFQTWVCTLSMLLGRLEIFLLIVPLTPAFWRD